jgi:hypothetical protein
VTVSADGHNAYVASFLSDSVAVFDRAADGTLTQKPGTAGCISDTGAGPCVDGTALAGAAAVTVSPDGKNLYAGAFVGNAVAVFDREPVPIPAPILTPGPTPAPTPTETPLAGDTTKPLLSALKVSPTRFRAAGSGPSVATRVGGKVSYKLSEPATVGFTVERALSGRRAGGHCVKPKRSNRRAKPCTRHQALSGGFTHRGKAGPNRFTFNGRLRSRKLSAGRYRLRAVATDVAGNKSSPKLSSFRIVRR